MAAKNISLSAKKVWELLHFGWHEKAIKPVEMAGMLRRNCRQALRGWWSSYEN